MRGVRVYKLRTEAKYIGIQEKSESCIIGVVRNSKVDDGTPRQSIDIHFFAFSGEWTTTTSI